MNEALEIKTITVKELPLITKIIKNIGVKEFKDCFNQPEIQKAIAGDSEADVQKLGVAIAMDIVTIIVEHYEECHSDVVKLISTLTGKTVSEVESFSLDAFVEVMIQIVTSDDFKGAFRQASRLLK